MSELGFSGLSITGRDNDVSIVGILVHRVCWRRHSGQIWCIDDIGYWAYCQTLDYACRYIILAPLMLTQILKDNLLLPCCFVQRATDVIGDWRPISPSIHRWRLASTPLLPSPTSLDSSPLWSCGLSKDLFGCLMLPRFEIRIRDQTVHFLGEELTKFTNWYLEQAIIYIRDPCFRFSIRGFFSKPKRFGSDWRSKIEDNIEKANFRTFYPLKITGGEMYEWIFRARPTTQPLIHLWRGTTGPSHRL